MLFAVFSQKTAYAPPVSLEIKLLKFPAAPHFRRKQVPELSFSVTFPPVKIITPRENAGFAERPHRGHNTSRA